MLLSEALVLKAEWWVTPYSEMDEIRELLGDNNHLTRKHFYSIIPEDEDHTHWDNDSAANLCLLESELQKDEEYSNELETKIAEHKSLFRE